MVVARAVTVAVTQTLKNPIHDEEGDDGESGCEALPHHAGVPVIRTEGVGQEVDEGVTHQGAHSQRDQQLQRRLLVRALTSQKTDDRGVCEY